MLPRHALDERQPLRVDVLPTERAQRVASHETEMQQMAVQSQFVNEAFRIAH